MLCQHARWQTEHQEHRISGIGAIHFFVIKVHLTPCNKKKCKRKTGAEFYYHESKKLNSSQTYIIPNAHPGTNYLRLIIPGSLLKIDIIMAHPTRSDLIEVGSLMCVLICSKVWEPLKPRSYLWKMHHFCQIR